MKVISLVMAASALIASGCCNLIDLFEPDDPLPPALAQALEEGEGVLPDGTPVFSLARYLERSRPLEGEPSEAAPQVALVLPGMRGLYGTRLEVASGEGAGAALIARFGGEDLRRQSAALVMRREPENIAVALDLRALLDADRRAPDLTLRSGDVIYTDPRRMAFLYPRNAPPPDADERGAR